MVIRSLLPMSLETMHDPKQPVLLIALKIFFFFFGVVLQLRPPAGT
jgi:hypothetical protein